MLRKAIGGIITANYSYAVGMDWRVQTALISIFSETLFLNQLHTFSFLSIKSFYTHFSNKKFWEKILKTKILSFSN